MTGSVNGTSVPTETSPLLRNSGSEAANGNGNGTVDTGDQQNGTTAAAADTDTDENRDGNPEMAKKMHFLLPAVGIGVGSTPARALPRRKAFGSGSDLSLRCRPAAHRGDVRQDRERAACVELYELARNIVSNTPSLALRETHLIRLHVRSTTSP
ncbi:major facilitator superfamily transporter [Colletotrichum nymphaeae SA-01]|uniref:Major facilitator superfamily transporter n=1 Tax=Colletotrichum nymphaeae SA-01 TaxID=1460502 RepID=A0A135SVV9_9PEZI|nr:major facilitator superfamily transporter [Colletotrichum nymphaeae SA-01]